MQAKLSQQKQQYAKRPRIKTITSVATRASVDAEYLSVWQEKVELIGNLNYPPEARKQKLYGRLRLLVSLLPDGSVHNIDVLESSGQRVLDDAAIRIVRLAAPFAPFPPELKKNVDQFVVARKCSDIDVRFPGQQVHELGRGGFFYIITIDYRNILGNIPPLFIAKARNNDGIQHGLSLISGIEIFRQHLIAYWHDDQKTEN